MECFRVYRSIFCAAIGVLFTCKLFATQALSQTQKNISEPQTGIEPATF